MLTEGAGVEPNQGTSWPSQRGLEPSAGADRRRTLPFQTSPSHALGAGESGFQEPHKKTPHVTYPLVRGSMRR